MIQQAQIQLNNLVFEHEAWVDGEASGRSWYVSWMGWGGDQAAVGGEACFPHRSADLQSAPADLVNALEVVLVAVAKCFADALGRTSSPSSDFCSGLWGAF